MVEKIIERFRKKLTDAENACWSDEAIIEAFENTDEDVAFLRRIGVKEKMLDASTTAVL